MAGLDPYTDKELWEHALADGSFSRHLLTIYSLAVGMNAKVILDIGVGSTTSALRAAAEKTNGSVHSCDADKERYGHLVGQQDEHWNLFIGPSEEFLETIQAPVDLAVHDGAHDYFQVKLDLELLLPRMRTFGIICLHDTQQSWLAHEMLEAIRAAVEGWPISFTNLPFGAGLGILRMEEGKHPPITPAGKTLSDGTFDTRLVASPMQFAPDVEFSNADNSRRRWLRWRLRKILKGY